MSSKSSGRGVRSLSVEPSLRITSRTSSRVLISPDGLPRTGGEGQAELCLSRTRVNFRRRARASIPCWMLVCTSPYTCSTLRASRARSGSPSRSIGCWYARILVGNGISGSSSSPRPPSGVSNRSAGSRGTSGAPERPGGAVERSLSCAPGESSLRGAAAAWLAPHRRVTAERDDGGHAAARRCLGLRSRVLLPLAATRYGRRTLPSQQPYPDPRRATPGGSVFTRRVEAP
jgi:hypothetical protein